MHCEQKITEQEFQSSLQLAAEEYQLTIELEENGNFVQELRHLPDSQTRYNANLFLLVVYSTREARIHH
jgi:hypothetical protein